MEDKTLGKLKQYLELVNGSVTKEDFNKFATQALELILKIENKTRQEVDGLKRTYSALLTSMENRHDTTFKDLRKQVDGLFVGEKVEGMSKEHLEKMRKVDEALGRLEDRMSKIRDGRTPKKGVDYFDGRTPRKGVDYFDGLLDEKSLEELKEDVKGLKEELERIKQIRSRGNLGMKKITYSRSHDMSDQVDGAKRVFTLPIKTISVQAVRISYFPYNLRKNVDWTINGNNLTLTSEIATPPLTHTIIADIEVPFYY